MDHLKVLPNRRRSWQTYGASVEVAMYCSALHCGVFVLHCIFLQCECRSNIADSRNHQQRTQDKLFLFIYTKKFCQPLRGDTLVISVFLILELAHSLIINIHWAWLQTNDIINSFPKIESKNVIAKKEIPSKYPFETLHICRVFLMYSPIYKTSSKRFVTKRIRFNMAPKRFSTSVLGAS